MLLLFLRSEVGRRLARYCLDFLFNFSLLDFFNNVTKIKEIVNVSQGKRVDCCRVDREATKE